jgi:hypothetical protein
MTKFEYVVVNRCGLIPFQEQVNKYLKDGWKLSGGLVVIPTSGISHEFFQSMIRKIDTDIIDDEW